MQKIGLNSLKYDYRQKRILDFFNVENFFGRNGMIPLKYGALKWKIIFSATEFPFTQ